LTAADDGSAVTVAPGDEIAVRLDETPTTGFRWEIDALEGPLEHIGDEREIEPDTPPGGGSMRVFRFRATERGRGQIALKNRREWEGDASITQRFSVLVDVT
jgi:predicted secreted protein